MKSLLTFKTKKEFINRINKLTPSNQAPMGNYECRTNDTSLRFTIRISY